MGYYKKILLMAEEGDRDAMLKVAEEYREKWDLKKAIYWYGKLNKTKEVEELKALLVVATDEDIFA